MAIKNKKLKVFYGFAKLTPKIVRKKELVIFFENDNNNISKNEKFVNQKIKVIYTRFQTKKEKSVAIDSNRMFTKYGYFIDDKRWKGNIERVLEDNYVADKNHLTAKEREKIRNLLRTNYFEFYNIDKKTPIQTALIFN